MKGDQSVIQMTEAVFRSDLTRAMNAYIEDMQSESTTRLTDDNKAALLCGFCAGWRRSAACVLRNGNTRFEREEG
jgi:hypothetical protein